MGFSGQQAKAALKVSSRGDGVQWAAGQGRAQGEQSRGLGSSLLRMGWEGRDRAADAYIAMHGDAWRFMGMHGDAWGCLKDDTA